MDLVKKHVHKQKQRNVLYVACEDNNFIWCEIEVAKFRELWRNGASIKSMKKILNRTETDIVLLVIDQGNKNFIKPRKGGLLGCA